MNLKLARMFVVFTGFMALCSAGAAVWQGLRLQADRALLQELVRGPECPPAAGAGP